jgi:hypothetical protein
MLSDIINKYAGMLSQGVHNLSDTISKPFQAQTVTLQNGRIIPTVNAAPVKPTIALQAPAPLSTVAPQATPTVVPQTNSVEDYVTKAIQIYGGQNAPMLSFVPQIAAAVQKYPFLKNNPELIPLIGHLETSSGKNITRPNNLLNWGINYPGNNEIFSTMTQQQVLDRALSGLGQRSEYYNQFRTGNPLTDEQLLQLAKVYEPANNSYGPNLVNGRNFIRSKIGTL